MDELAPVARAAAEEGLFARVVGKEGLDAVDIPDAVVVDEIEVVGSRGNGAASFRITLIGKRPVTTPDLPPSNVAPLGAIRGSNVPAWRRVRRA